MSVEATIVIVTHRGPGELVRACLESLDTSNRRDGAVATFTIVVDNSGRPPADPGDYGPGVGAVLRLDNRGFGAAANAGIRHAGTIADVPVAVLNDDTEVVLGWLPPLLDALAEDDRLGAVQPVLLQHDSTQVSSLGVQLDRFGAGSDLGFGTSLTDLARSFEIPIFTGGAVLFRPAFLAATGGFDERYFLYYEDVDLALRGAELGWTYRCEVSSHVRHRGGATTAALGDELRAYQERNRLWTAVRFGSPRMVLHAFWLSIRRLRHRPRAVHARALGAGAVGAVGAFARRVAARRRAHNAMVMVDGG